MHEACPPHRPKPSAPVMPHLPTEQYQQPHMKPPELGVPSSVFKVETSPPLSTNASTVPMSESDRPRKRGRISNLTFTLRERLRLFCNVGLVKEVFCILVGLCAAVWLTITWDSETGSIEQVIGDGLFAAIYTGELLLRYLEWGVRGIPALDYAVVILIISLFFNPFSFSSDDVYRKVVVILLSVRYLYYAAYFKLAESAEYFNEDEQFAVDLEHAPLNNNSSTAFASPQSLAYGSISSMSLATPQPLAGSGFPYPSYKINTPQGGHDSSGVPLRGGSCAHSGAPCSAEAGRSAVTSSPAYGTFTASPA